MEKKSWTKRRLFSHRHEVLYSHCFWLFVLHQNKWFLSCCCTAQKWKLHSTVNQNELQLFFGDRYKVPSPKSNVFSRVSLIIQIRYFIFSLAASHIDARLFGFGGRTEMSIIARARFIFLGDDEKSFQKLRTISWIAKKFAHT